jgi:butyrate kinase
MQVSRYNPSARGFTDAADMSFVGSAWLSGRFTILRRVASSCAIDSKAVKRRMRKMAKKRKAKTAVFSTHLMGDDIAIELYSA